MAVPDMGYGDPRRACEAGGPTAPRRARAHHMAREPVSREASWRCVRG
jgi:hypothetical protein